MLNASQLKAGGVERVLCLTLTWRHTWHGFCYVVSGHNGREHVWERYANLKDARQAFTRHTKTARVARAERYLFMRRQGLEAHNEHRV